MPIDDDQLLVNFNLEIDSDVKNSKAGFNS